MLQTKVAMALLPLPAAALPQHLQQPPLPTKLHRRWLNQEMPLQKCRDLRRHRAMALKLLRHHQ